MKAHICIGGPLNGMHATSADFYGRWISDGANSHHEEGMYEHMKNIYVQFNNATRPVKAGKHGRQRAQVAWIHVDLLTPSISPKDR